MSVVKKQSLPAVAIDRFDEREEISSAHPFKILVIGHAYDIFLIKQDGINQEAFAEFINQQNADLVVFGGDTIVGPQTNDIAPLAGQWAEFGRLRARISARAIMVAGNHDGWSNFNELMVPAYSVFASRNKINYEIDLLIGNKKTGLFFVYTGDFTLPVNRLAPLAERFKFNDENLVFGGHRRNGIGVLETLNISTPGRIKYFSGDSEADNSPIYLEHVDAYNVTSICKEGFDADLITISESETKIEHLGNCGR